MFKYLNNLNILFSLQITLKNNCFNKISRIATITILLNRLSDYFF